MAQQLSAIRTTDSDTLALLGKKQVLKRRFGFWSLFGFAVCELITWETVLALFSQGFDNGGPAGLVYGFIIAWSSTFSVYTVISELASMAPIAAGQYYWVFMLAPPRWKVFSSYVIGWLTSLAWVATVATETIFAGTILQGLIILTHPDYDAKLWQGTLMAWMVISVNIFVNVVIPGFLPRFEIFIIVFHIAGFIGIVSTLWVYAPHGSAHFVFATSLNEGGWSTQGLSYCVGFLGNVATFVGADASVHLAEEVEAAERNIPKAILCSMCINGAVGFVMMITVLFCLGDVESVLGTETGYPFIQIFYNSVRSIKGAAVMGAIVLALTWACSIGITTTASRMTWSFARDNGTPMSRLLSKVSPRTKVPTIAVFVVAALAALLTCIYIGSPTAFNDVVSLTITGFYSSYFLPAAFLLWHRIKGNIAPHGNNRRTSMAGLNPDMHISKTNSESSKALNSSGLRSNGELHQHELVFGPFHVPGWFGIINNAYACVYMIFVIFWSVWPPSAHPTVSTMNYSVVVTFGVMFLSMVWYFVRARKTYQGPLREELDTL